MADLLSFTPLFTETLDRIRARINADANAGLTPLDANFLDTTPGGFFWDLTQAPALEMERMWDSLNEMAAACFPAYAWGIYLDEHGVTLDLPRKDAVAATGLVTFTGTPNTLVATGTQVGTVQVSPDADPLVFSTTAPAVIPAGGALDVPVQAVTRGASSNVAPGAVAILLSPIDGISAVANAAAVGGGADIEDDESYRARLMIAFAGAHGSGTIADYTQWALAYEGVSYVKVEPIWNGAGTVRVIVTDADNRAVSQAVIDGLQNVLDPFSGTTTTTGSQSLPVATLNVVSTAGFQASGVLTVGGQQVSYTGKTGTAFTGCTGGTGSVPNGTVVHQSGLGHGLAPIGAIVTVATPTGVTVNVGALVTPQTGYTLDGTGGTIALRPDIQQAVSDYIDGLRPGDSVILQAVVARIMDVNGVLDVGSVTLNGVAANVTIGNLQVAVAGTVTLT